eukprot:CAMPEP_0113536272 /NCGR_PEP_ID=MMETSP0015_2-20120614/6161_1 /TAXON_ID=2838 /ORGANISM="Odontella" /LENGTH=291 /DNA_ID=CAMNT_0000435603 /DNA_START=56 /DNA_END=931 /DNA_ORIENTATION=- /assembly_acc=CAM_ASM_000160
MAKAKIGKDGDGVMMILSPAKTLDLRPFEKSSSSFPPITSPSCSEEKTKHLVNTLKAHSEKSLGKLLGVSAKIAETACRYYEDFQLDPSERIDDGMKPALFAFSGAAYQGLQALTCTEAEVHYMQNNLRIIDPLYGALRPMDSIQPYRLEMATKKLLKAKDMGESKDLACWWKKSVTSSIGAELEGRSTKILLNLASDEYSAAVDSKSLPEGTQFVKVVFQQEGRVIAVHAKRARGLMVRFVAENNIREIESVKLFNAEGYKFVKGRSSDCCLVFDRKKQPATVAAKKEQS